MDGEQLDPDTALAHARDLRDAGTAQVDAHSPDEWKSNVDAAIRSLASLGQPFTADDVRALDGITDPPSPQAWGARFLAAAKQGVIVRIGYTPSRRASVHGHPVAQWQGKAA